MRLIWISLLLLNFAYEAYAATKEDYDFLSRTARSCKIKALNPDEMQRLKSMQEDYLLNFQSRQILSCNENREIAARDKANLDVGLEKTSKICKGSFERFVVFNEKAQNDKSMLTKYTEMLSLGEVNEACKPIDAFMADAESLRLDLVSCFKSISDGASADQLEVRKLALKSAQSIGLSELYITGLYEACFRR